MTKMVRPTWSGMSASLVAIVLALAGPALPVLAQDAQAELRVRKLEAEVRALQRKVFPGGDSKLFTPEITAGTAADKAAAPASSTTAVTDLLTRIDALETQLARLTGQIEQNTNRISQLEARVGVAAPPPGTAAAVAAVPTTATAAPSATSSAGVPAPAVSPATSATPAATAPAATAPAAPSSAAPSPAATSAATPPAAAKPAASPAAQANLNVMSGGASKARPAATTPSSQRVAAVRAIEKPQTGDAGDDEYSYGFRLWEAKFYPEAQQQLGLFVQKYPKHKRSSWGRNLLGRAYLDDGNPKEAAKWFLENYQSDKRGDRAADSLLFLGVSMKQLKDNKRACIALAEFAETYAAEAAGRLKGLYDSTRSGLVCS